jgi:hypothetical protein
MWVGAVLGAELGALALSCEQVSPEVLDQVLEIGKAGIGLDYLKPLGTVANGMSRGRDRINC